MRRRVGFRSVGGLVIAGGAAGLAVHQAVGAQADVELGLAQNAELLTPATGFNLLTLGTTDRGAAGFGGHEGSVVCLRPGKNVTKVTGKQVTGHRSQVSGKPVIRIRLEDDVDKRTGSGFRLSLRPET